MSSLVRERRTWPPGLFWLAVILLATLPARLSLMRQSLGLDEAWVANSVLANSWHEMFQGTTWVQSSPPLFLTLLRSVIAAAGPGDWALRLVPWLASLSACVVVFLALKPMFGRAAALLGATMLATNYWAIKMAQQVKPYGADLLVSALFLYALQGTLTQGRGRRSVLLLAGLCCLGHFVSSPAVFWLPSTLAALAVRAFWRDGDGRPRALFVTKARAKRLAGLTLAVAVSLGLNYFIFLRPNLGNDLKEYWRDAFMNFDGLPYALVAFGQNLGHLLLPPASRLAVYASSAVLIIALAGLGCALVDVLRAAPRGPGCSEGITDPAAVALLAGPLPILAGMAFSLAHLYPLLTYPRMIVWLLPCIVTLVAHALQRGLRLVEERLAGPAGHRVLDFGVPAACLVAAVAGQALLFRYPRPAEHNRPAVQLLASQAAAHDTIFLHGGTSEAFAYYSRLLGWRPRSVYLGNTGWPCCPKNQQERVSHPEVREFADDLILAAGQARGHRLWLYLPAATDGHWTRPQRSTLESAARHLAGAGCTEHLRKSFDQIQVWAFDCK